MSEQRYQPRTQRKLYKNPDDAKIWGVCAGIAEYFELEVWLVRVIAASLLLMMNGTAFLAYVILCFVLDPKPGSKSNRGCFGSEKKRQREPYDKTQTSKPYRTSVKDVWKSGNTPKDSLNSIETKFSAIEKKLQAMETFVTSHRFELEKEFREMER